MDTKISDILMQIFLLALTILIVKLEKIKLIEILVQGVLLYIIIILLSEFQKEKIKTIDIFGATLSGLFVFHLIQWLSKLIIKF